LIVNYKTIPTEPCLNASDPEYFNSLRKAFPNQLLYKLWLVITQDVNFLNLERKEIQGSFTKSQDLKRLQQKKPLSATSLSTMSKRGLSIDASIAKDFRSKLDRVLTHKLWGM
jgi:ferrous iron transport protein B